GSPFSLRGSKAQGLKGPQGAVSRSPEAPAGSLSRPGSAEDQRAAAGRAEGATRQTSTGARKTMTGHAIATSLIDAAQVSQYHADGFVVVKGVFGPERIAELEAEAERLRQRTDLIQ